MSTPWWYELGSRTADQEWAVLRVFADGSVLPSMGRIRGEFTTAEAQAEVLAWNNLNGLVPR